jgi:hypothetical protein
MSGHSRGQREPLSLHPIHYPTRELSFRPEPVAFSASGAAEKSASPPQPRAPSTTHLALLWLTSRLFSLLSLCRHSDPEPVEGGRIPRVATPPSPFGPLQPESHRSRSSPPNPQTVISTGAAHSTIVSSAAKKSASLPQSLSAIATQGAPFMRSFCSVS